MCAKQNTLCIIPYQTQNKIMCMYLVNIQYMIK